MNYSIAIDGPAAAGKSTIARSVAEKTGLTYINTGAMYRAIAYWCMQNGIPTREEEPLKSRINEINIDISYKDGIQQLILNGENVTEELNSEEVGREASRVSQFAFVRLKLVKLQQEIAKKQPVVMDGRDIGTKVLPGAFFKIFMTASSSVRAKRRYDELIARGVECDYNTILSDIEHRDYEDENRELAPLKQASDAIVIDTSDMTIEEASDKITELFKNKKEEYERNHKG